MGNAPLFFQEETAMRRMQPAFPVPAVVLGLFLAAAPVAPVGAADAGDGPPPVLITLRGNPSTGYFWSWTATGGGAVREADVQYSQDNPMPGSPASYTYSFAGVRPGEVELRFLYSRTDPPEPESPVNTYRLRVLPDLTVELLDKEEAIPELPSRR